MGSKVARQRKQRSRLIELLEERRVMAADPLSQLLSGSLQQHQVDDAPTEQHENQLDDSVAIAQQAVNDALLTQHGGLTSDAPSLIHHSERDADFWIDSWSERDLDTLLGELEQTLASAHGSTGLTSARNDYGFIGTGQTVAIIDSGIAYDHAALGGGLGPNYRVVGGWDFTEENDANPYDDGWAGSHGTHVAGIVGSDRAGTNDDGVAPGVDLVGLRVFNDQGEGYFSWVENALRWVHQNRNAFDSPITAVNLSLGTSWNATTVPNWTTLEDEFAQLKADGIFVTVSAGNSFGTYNATGLSYPAASPYVVPVMSVDDNGSLSSFSQRHSRAIAAPGRYIVSTVPDYVGNHNGVTDDYASYSGTSMAAPYIAGASVLIREAMQFVGYMNITQDTIFNHMMATATSFFDAATSQSYKRIDVAAALNALIPTDEYGSTIDTAHDLGTLAGSSEISGLIGKLSDSDYFRFTAAANGTVTFTADTTHGMTPVWMGTGKVSGDHGETYTLDVVAGQSYTLGLKTGGGIGFYGLTIDAEAAFTFVDWGTITQAQVNDVANAGESWYRVQASQAGYFTAEALFASAGGNVNIALFDSNLQLLAEGTANGSGARVDALAGAGAELFLRVTGTNADIDFRLTNLVSVDGSIANIAGTSAADTFTFAAGAAQHSVSVNGTTYQFDRAAVSTINFAGGAGSDSITLTGTAGNETAVVRVGNAKLTGSGFSATAGGIENVVVYGGGGTDTATLYDSAGDDNLNAWSTRVTLDGASFCHAAHNFSSTYVYASTGNDVARAYDTAGDDRCYSSPERLLITGTGYYNWSTGFDVNYVYARYGGNDTAYFYGSSGDDRFYGAPDYARLIGPGFNHYVQGFDQSYCYGDQGGTDTAYFYGSTGDDRFYGAPTYARMLGNGFNHYVQDFEVSYGYADQGGNDTAYFFGSAGDDRFYGAPDYARLIGPGFNHYAQGFDQSYCYGDQGGNDTAYFYGSTGDDRFYGAPTYARMLGNGFNHYVQDFEVSYGYADQGGNDTAYFYGSAGDDRFYGAPTYARMIGNGFNHYSQGFEQSYAYADQGGNDTAYFYGSAGDDRFYGAPTYARIIGTGFNHYAQNFDQSYAYADQGGIDTAYFYGSTGNDRFYGAPNYAQISGSGFNHYAQSFERSYTDVKQGGIDTAYFYGSTGDDYFYSAASYQRMLGNGFNHYTEGFGRAYAYADQGGTDRAYIYDLESNDAVFGRAGYVSNSRVNRLLWACDFDFVTACTKAGCSSSADVSAVDYLFEKVGAWT